MKIANRIKEFARNLTGAESRILIKDADALKKLAKELGTQLKTAGQQTQKNTAEDGGVKSTGIKFSKDNQYPYDMQTVINEYLAAVDLDLLQFIENSLDNRDVFKRHGKNGEADTSMSNHNDLARIQYILENYDDIELALDENGEQIFSREFMNKDNKSAPVIILSKKINGTYYISEVVFENKYNKLWVASARISKNKSGDFTQAPNKSGSYLASRSSANYIIHDNTKSSNNFESNSKKKSFSDYRYSYGDEEVDLWGLLDPEESGSEKAKQRLHKLNDIANRLVKYAGNAK